MASVSSFWGRLPIRRILNLVDTITIPIEAYREDPNSVQDVVREDKNPYDLVRAPIIRVSDFLKIDVNDEFNFRTTRGQHITKGFDPSDRRTVYGPVRVDRNR